MISVFAEQRSVLSEQQNPVFRQNLFLASNLTRNDFYKPLKAYVDAKFCVDSESDAKNVVSRRNLEINLKNRFLFFAVFVVFLTASEEQLSTN